MCLSVKSLSHARPWALLSACVLCLMAAVATAAPAMRTRTIGTFDGLPSDYVQQVFQDSQGFLWFGTRNGLACYNGNSMQVYKSDIRRGDQLTNNSISCLAEDSLNRIWIGTSEGLNYIDRRTATVHKIGRQEFKGNPISSVLPTRNRHLLVGTDQGLYSYDAESDSLVLYTREMSGDVMPQTSIKSLLLDSRGNIWIGTWNEGIYRLDNNGRFHSYPRINDRKSAHVIFEDSSHRIWVGSWGRGLFLLRNPYEPSKATWENYSYSEGDPSSLSDNIIYSISEDPSTRTIWVGTAKGLSILDEATSSFSQVRNIGGDRTVREVTSIICDRVGSMWISMIGQGVCSLSPVTPGLALDRLEPVRSRFGINSVQRILVDTNDRMWISLGANSGMVVYDPADGSVETFPSYVFSATSSSPYTVQCITQLSDGKVCIGTYDGGLYVVDDDRATVTHYSKDANPWVAGDRVSEVFEDRHGRIWIGAMPGLSVRMRGGAFCRFDDVLPEDIIVTDIEQGADDCIWVSTRNVGVLCINGAGNSPSGYSIRSYNPDKGNLNTAHIATLYCDGNGRVWAGGDGAGLSLYDFKSDAFVPVHMRWNLPGDMVSSITGDDAGNLWIGSDMGLYKLHVPDDTVAVNFRVFTSGDGAQDNVFTRNAVCKDRRGRMFFGGPHGINIVNGEMPDRSEPTLPVTITDIKVYGVSWERLGEARSEISTLAPGYTDAITLDHSRNNFSIEFQVLDFANHPIQHKYAYRLDGFDSDWQYPDPSRRFAYYNNLPAGTYTFRVRTSDPDGAWSGDERTLKVTIEPPAWATWWAKLIYFIVFASAAWSIYKVSRRRVQRRNELRMRELELAQAEELNRAKLSFFTNVTHEWLTPLSIISAVAQEMKGDTPEQRECHRVMMTSIGRLSHLLQQVLEFRKAESGNLRLRVAEGDIVRFISNIVDNIMPVFKSRNIDCTFSSDSQALDAWFDADKVDKILYNLLSNAAKYVPEGGRVNITLSCLAASKVEIRVADNGPGIAASQLPELFKRFYQGGHISYNSSSNGIGLSLTKDLVELHHGSITADSVLGQGTVFTVVIPVGRDDYASGEIDNQSAIQSLDEPVEYVSGKNTDIAGSDAEKETLLIVEDDVDLLGLIARLLENYYTVLRSSSAEMALEILEKNDVALIISDMMMPGIGGAEFCRRVKTRLEWSHIPIMLLTANTLEEAQLEAYEAGADAFMQKPFSITVLQARVSNLLRTRSAATRSFREQFDMHVDASGYSTLDESFLKKSVGCISAHLADPAFSQSEFAAEMGVTKSTLFRKLKSLTGLSYSSFVRNIRLKTACRIMEEKPGVRISEVAYAVGFNDPKYFSLCFKKEFGMLPTEYIDRYIKSRNSDD